MANWIEAKNQLIMEILQELAAVPGEGKQSDFLVSSLVLKTPFGTKKIREMLYILQGSKLIDYSRDDDSYGITLEGAKELNLRLQNARI